MIGRPLKRFPANGLLLTGSLGSRSGSRVFEHRGTFENGVATVKLVVVPGSGTGDLGGLQGVGEFAVGHQPPYCLTLDYSFD